MGLERAEGVFEFLVFRLAEEQVHVLRHQDVSEEIEAVTLAGLFEGVEEHASCVVVVE